MPRTCSEQPEDAIVATPKAWTVLSMIEWGAAFLKERGFDEARLHIELLLAHVLGLTRMGLYLQFDRLLQPEELARFKPLFERRLRHEPLQYILGETEFMGLSLTLTPSVLIPRPETELLVERVLEHLAALGKPSSVLEIGTGSGNIAVAIAHHAPGCRVVTLDNSSEALRIAAMNVSRHHLKNVDLVELDIMRDPLPGLPYDCIVSNPPYVPLEEYLRLEPEVREFEPRAAATDSADGLSFYRRIAALAQGRLTTQGALFLEIGFGQNEAVQYILQEAGLKGLAMFRDYAGIPRVIRAQAGEASP